MGGDHSAKPRITLLARLLHQHYARAIDAELRAAGFDDIRPGDAKVFAFVPPGGISIGELAVRAGVRKQTMAAAVERLTRTSYLERKPNPRDKRSQLLFLTERGRAVQPVGAEAGRRAEARWAELTSDEEVETLRSLLRNLVSKLDEAMEELRTQPKGH